MATTNRTQIFDDLNTIFADVLDLDDVALADATNADDIEEWDSLSHIRLIVSVERHYGIKFSNAEIESLKTVGDLVDRVIEKAA